LPSVFDSQQFNQQFSGVWPPLNNDVFYTWVNAAYTTTSPGVMQYNVFPFNSTQQYTTSIANTYVNWVVADERTKEQKQADLERANQAARLRRQQDEIDATQRASATRRARSLLIANLTPDQAKMYEEAERFRVTARSGRLYEIRKGSHGNIYVIENGIDGREHTVERLCVQPGMWNLPVEDVLVAQKLAIQLNEEELRKTANISDLRGYGRVAA
jgi:hypothetical protein